MNNIFLDIEFIILIAGFLIITISADRIASVFQKIKLPLITGLLIAGVITGPYVLDLIPIESKTRLNFISELSLAFIAFAAGSELYLRELRSRINSIKWNTFWQLVATFGLGSIAVFFVSDMIPFMSDMDFATKLSSSLLIGAIFGARSPASAIAIIKELRAKGPFTQTILGVTVLKDFIVIVVFTICLSFAQSIISGIGINLIGVLIILTELSLSLALGILIGKILALIYSFRIHTLSKSILVVLSGYGVYAFSHYIRGFGAQNLAYEIILEPLLICIVGSFYLTNYTRFRAEFLKFIHDTGNYIYVVFFTLIGATMSVDILILVWPAALILFGIRLVTMALGSYAGSLAAKDPPLFKYVGWMPYLTQAGVALGLSTAVANEFPDWGNEFATLIIAIIVLNQFVGPPLFKWALHKVGEDRSRASTPQHDGTREAIIIGYENQSITLARQLQQKDWQVQLATLKKAGSFQEPEDLMIKYVNEISFEQLKGLSADKTEAIICMLSDNENYEICEIAYQHLGTKDLIVRLNEHKNYEKFRALGARIVDPSMAMVNLLEHFVRSPQATSLILGLESGQDSRDIELFNPNFYGIALRDLRLPSDVIILSIKRGGQMIISHGYTRLRKGDIITMVGSDKSLDDIAFKFER